MKINSITEKEKWLQLFDYIRNWTTLEKMSNQGQISQDLNHDIMQLEHIIQQLKAKIENINANTTCPQLAHITTRFLTILVSRAQEKLRNLRQNQN